MVSSRVNISFEMVESNRVVLHDQIQESLRAALMSCTYKLCSRQPVSDFALDLFLKTHPIVVIKRRRGWMACIAGLRSFQLVVTRISPEQKILVCVVSGIRSDEIADISAADIYLTGLIFGLEGENRDQAFLQIWNALNSDLLKSLTPGLHTKTKLAEYLGINRRRLSQKKPLLRSKLRTTLSSNGGDL